ISALFGIHLFRVLFSADYEPAAHVLTLLASGMAITSLAAFGSVTVTSGRVFRMHLANSVFCFLVSLSCYGLIANGGIAGAGTVEIIRFMASTIFISLA